MIDGKLKEKIIKLAEENDKTEEEILILFNAIKEEVKELCPYLTQEKLNYRTYNGLEGYLSDKKFGEAQEFTFIPLGIFSEAKDKNSKLIEQIKKDFSKPNKRLELINEGKVMVMKTSEQEINGEDVLYTDVYKPVKSIKSTTKLDNGEVVVVEGELWNPGDDIIPRDFRKEIKTSEEAEPYTNRNWSKPLRPNWKLILFGIGYFDGVKQVKDREGNIVKVKKNAASDGLITKVDFYGDVANPKNPKFFPASDPFFKECKIKATMKQYSTELILSVLCRLGKTDSIIINKDKKIKFNNWEDKEGKMHLGLIPIINKRIAKQAKKAKAIYDSADMDEMPKAKAKKLQELYNLHKKYLTLDYIPLIDMSEIDAYHKSHKAKHDKDGNIIKQIGKDKNGNEIETWDEIDFDSFAISECTLKGIYEADGKAPKMILSDMSITDAVFAKFANGLNTNLRSAQVYVSLTTSRGNKAYDPEVDQWVFDPENAVAIPKIKGVGLLINFKKLNLKHLKGDL